MDEEIELGIQGLGLFGEQPDAVDAYGNPINVEVPETEVPDVKGEGLSNAKVGQGIAAAGMVADGVEKAGLGGNSFGTYANNITKYAGAGAQVGGIYGAAAGVALGIGASVLEEKNAAKVDTQNKAIENNTATTVKKKGLYDDTATAFYGGMQDEAQDVYGVDQLLNANKTLLS